MLAGLGLAAAELMSSAAWCVTHESAGPLWGAFPRICPHRELDGVNPVVHLYGVMRSMSDS